MLYTVHQMFILRTSNVTNVITMSIKLNTKQSNITVYDEVGYKHATGKEVVPLITNIRGDFKIVLINIIADSLNLTNSERELYTILINHKGEFEKYTAFKIQGVTEVASKSYRKSNISYRRAIDVLIRLGVIRYGIIPNTIVLNSEYDIRDIEDIAKYIVIEVNRRDTLSQGTDSIPTTGVGVPLVDTGDGTDSVGGSGDGTCEG